MLGKDLTPKERIAFRERHPGVEGVTDPLPVMQGIALMIEQWKKRYKMEHMRDHDVHVIGLFNSAITQLKLKKEVRDESNP